MVQILHKEMLDHGVELVLGDSVVAFHGSDVELKSGRAVPGDAVVMAVGVRPDTALAVQAGLAANQRGALLVDANYQTSDPDIYAVGDAVEVFNAITHKPMMLQLAGPAQKQARQAADHLMGRPVRNTGYIGSSCIRVFGYNAASTGFTEAQCQQEGLAYETAYVLPKDRVALMPGSCPMHFKLIFEKPTAGCWAHRPSPKETPPSGWTWQPPSSSSAARWTICGTSSCAMRRLSPPPRTR